MINRSLNFCVVATWLVLSLGAAATAQEFQYKTNDGAITITAYIGAGGNVIIPSSVGGLPVTSISNHAFSFSRNVTGITVPNSVTNMGGIYFEQCSALTNITLGSGVTAFSSSFIGCSNLNRITVDPLNAVYRSVDGILFNKSQTTLVRCPTGRAGGYTIPSAVKTIGDSAFSFCNGLTNIVIPNNVTVFGDSAFSSCSNLASVTIEGTVTNIWYSAFANCVRLTSVTLPVGVNSIRGSAFAGCASLTNVFLPYTVMSIWSGAFADCVSLTNITIPRFVNSISYGAFQRCSSLIQITVDQFNSSYSSVDGVLFNKSQDTIVQYPQAKGGGYAIPNGVTWIQDFAFLDCANLAGITIPSGLIHIGALAFGGCTALPGITIPETVNSIGDYAFNRCAILNGITVNPLNSFYGSVDGILFDKSQTTIIQFPGGKTGSYAIPNGVTSIALSAFANCGGLSTVTIPNSITSIGDYAFPNCSNLISVVIPNSVTNIGYNAFSGCTSLTGISLPNNVSRIGSLAFHDCSGLTNITVPSSVTSIGDAPFLGCASLKEIMVDALNPVFTSVDGVLFNKGQTTLLGYPGGKAGTYSIPNTVTNITAAFSGCARLTSVIIPDSIAAIGSHAFSDCSSLAKVTIPSSVTSIENSAFSGCRSLVNLTIPEGVTSIGVEVFSDCTALRGIYFSADAVNIDLPVLNSANNSVVYYLPGSTGWGASFWGHPTAFWQPSIQISDARSGVGANRFGLSVNWASARGVVMEACTNLAGPVWLPLQTNTLASDSIHFSNMDPTDHPIRFYRLRSWPTP